MDRATFALQAGRPPVDPATNEKIGGTYYLWVYNGESTSGAQGLEGTYYLTAYNIDLEPFATKFEPNQNNVEVLNNGLVSTLPTDAVVRTFMIYNPDTTKFQENPAELQSNSQYYQSSGAWR